MKIGKPVATPSTLHRGGKYAQIWGEALALEGELAIPVEFDTRMEALYFRNGNHETAKKKGLQLNQRGTTVYVSRNGTD